MRLSNFPTSPSLALFVTFVISRFCLSVFAIIWRLQFLGPLVSASRIYQYCKILTYQPRRGTVPQVQGNRTESFGILTHPVVGKTLIGKSALRYTMPQNNFLKLGNWTRWSLALNCTHFSESSSHCCRKFNWKVYHRNHPTSVGIKTRRPIHNHALAGTADFWLSTWFPTEICCVGTLPILGSRFSSSLWQIRI